MGRCKNCKWWGVDFEGACDKVGNIQATENASRLFVLYADADDNQGLE